MLRVGLYALVTRPLLVGTTHVSFLLVRPTTRFPIALPVQTLRLFVDQFSALSPAASAQRLITWLIVCGRIRLSLTCA